MDYFDYNMPNVSCTAHGLYGIDRCANPPSSFPRKDKKPLTYWGNYWWHLIDKNTPHSRLVVLVSTLHHKFLDDRFQPDFGFWALDVNNMKIFTGTYPSLSRNAIEDSDELIFYDPYGTNAIITINQQPVDITWLIRKTCADYVNLMGA